MNRINIFPYLRIHSGILNESTRLQRMNIENTLKSKIASYGIIAEKLAGGVLSNHLKVEMLSTTSVKVNTGSIGVLLDGELIFLTVPETLIPTAPLTPNKSYLLYVVPKKTSYEVGTVGFENGSAIVPVSSGARSGLTKLAPYEYLLIDSSNSGNDGMYQIKSVSSTAIELVEPFAGTTENNLPFKIVGYYSDDLTPDPSMTTFSYDGYDLIFSQTTMNGVLLGRVYLNALGNITNIVDGRLTNLYKEIGTAQVNADNIVEGINKKVPTISQSANLEILNEVLADFLTYGIISGGTCRITNGDVLEISDAIAYEHSGQRVHAPLVSGIDLGTLLSQGVIHYGTSNYLCLRYKEYNSYEYYWSDINDPGAIVIAQVTVSDSEPFFSSNDIRIFCRVKSSGFKSVGFSTYTAMDGEIFYKNEKLWAGLGLNTVQIIDYVTLLEILNLHLQQIRKEECLRFTIYPDESKGGWMFHNGIAAPTFIGYKYRVTGLKKAEYPIRAWATGTDLKQDFMATKAGVEKVVDKDAAMVNSSLVTWNTAMDFNENKLLGLYYQPYIASPLQQQQINLVIDGQTQQSFVFPAARVDRVIVVELRIMPIDEVEVIIAQTET